MCNLFTERFACIILPKIHDLQQVNIEIWENMKFKLTLTHMLDVKQNGG